MKALHSVILVLVLAVAACRSVPQDVATAHTTTKFETAAAFDVAEDTLTKVAEKSAELDNASVTAAHASWVDHLAKARAARAVVAQYLVDSKAGGDLTGPYAVAAQLLSDMNGGFGAINSQWASMVDPANDAAAAQFVVLFRRDIERYRVLERKFDEWISQFKVKD